MTRSIVRTAGIALLTMGTGARGHTRAVEYMLAWLMIGWGVAVLLPGDILIGPTSKYLLTIASEPAWGVMAITVGSLRLMALIINGSWRRSPLLRLFGAVCGLMWWIWQGGIYWSAVSQGAPPFPNLSIYPVFVFFEGYSCFRCGQDARVQDSLGPSNSVSRSESAGYG